MTRDQLISSVTVHYGPRHDRVRVWNRGALAGELTVECDDGLAVAVSLIPHHTREDDDGVAGRPDLTLRAIDPADLGFALDCLRILTGETCCECLATDGEIVPATEHGLCDRHYDDASEGAYERSCESFYGGSAPYTQQEQYVAAFEDKRRGTR